MAVTAPMVAGSANTMIIFAALIIMASQIAVMAVTLVVVVVVAALVLVVALAAMVGAADYLDLQLVVVAIRGPRLLDHQLPIIMEGKLSHLINKKAS